MMDKSFKHMKLGDKLFEISIWLVGILVLLCVIYPLYYVMIASISNPFSELFTRQGDVIEQINFLSINSMPRKLLERCIRKAGNTCGQKFLICIWRKFRVLRRG